MGSHKLVIFALSAFLGGGGLHGVVVKKTFKPMPLSRSLGVDGIYRLELRDSDNKIRRQMVSRDVYSFYEIGDDFDDRIALDQARNRVRAVRAHREAARRLAENEAKARATRSAAEKRLGQLFLRQDMLPETEGF